MNQLVKMDLMDKNITQEDIDNAYKIINFDNYKLDFLANLYNLKSKYTFDEYSDYIFFYKQMQKDLIHLPILFVNMIYYWNKYTKIPEKYLEHRYPESLYFEELYFFYFYKLVDDIVNFEDKVSLFLNRVLKLNIIEKSIDSTFKKKLIKEIKSNETINSIEEIKLLCEYLSKYKNSIFNKCRNNYRDLHTHSFTTEFPKLTIIDDEECYFSKTHVYNSYGDCLELLNEFKILIDLFNEAMVNYFKNIVGVDD
jgi:hypothetical protein